MAKKSLLDYAHWIGMIPAIIFLAILYKWGTAPDNIRHCLDTIFATVQSFLIWVAWIWIYSCLASIITAFMIEWMWLKQSEPDAKKVWKQLQMQSRFTNPSAHALHAIFKMLWPLAFILWMEARQSPL